MIYSFLFFHEVSLHPLGKTTLFWKRAPALYYSLYLLLAILFTLKTSWAFLFVMLFFWKREKTQAFIALSLFLAMICYVQHIIYFPEESTGAFLFQITSAESSKKKFQHGTVYRGKIKKIKEEGKDETKCNLSASMFITEKLSLDYQYWVTGSIYTRNKGYYSIYPSHLPPIIDKKRIPFCSLREKSKNWLKVYIHKHYTQKPLSASFLVALTTGRNEDPLLKGNLTQIGCAHLLAISGFHFALIAAFCHFLLKPFFPYKLHAFLLLTLLLCYLLFLGKSASIYRAFIFSSCFLLGPIVERRSSSMNTLGVALGICLVIDPMMAIEMGFQLSFLATGAIIGFYPKIKRWVVFAKDKGLIRFFMQAIALNLAVHLVLTPLTLLYFHTVTFHSIFYNLLLPSLTSGSLILFMSASWMHVFVPLLARLLHGINNYFTDAFLSFAENRVLYEKTLFIENIPDWLVTCVFIGLYGFLIIDPMSTNELTLVD